MPINYRDKIQNVFNRFLTGSGQTKPAMRQALMQQAASIAGQPVEDSLLSVPEDLQNYIKKVALYAYKVTNKDIKELKEAGYTEREIYEITIGVAIGISQARLDLGLQLLHGRQ